jgi:GNAT superfamily N-acetyltransferase
VTLRPATAEDAAAIAWILRDSYRLLPAQHVPYEMPSYHAEFHREAMRDEATRWALLCERAQPVGVAMWRMLPGMSHLHLLFVAAESQGKGYGVRLLRHQQQEARREQSALRLYTLHCLRDSHWAMRFYKHQGYTLYESGDEGRITDLYLWIDACRKHDDSWPLRKEKALFYKRAKG